MLAHLKSLTWVQSQRVGRRQWRGCSSSPRKIGPGQIHPGATNTQGQNEGQPGPHEKLGDHYENPEFKAFLDPLMSNVNINVKCKECQHVTMEYVWRSAQICWNLHLSVEISLDLSNCHNTKCHVLSEWVDQPSASLVYGISVFLIVTSWVS